MDVLGQRYCVLDIEGISLEKDRVCSRGFYSRIHIFVWKAAIECFDSSKKVFRIVSCIAFNDLTRGERRHYDFFLYNFMA